ncbi:GOLPH3/VPS74 family protein [Saccharopolyspora cebuensis]|uniref:GPP34 family phosphoprotein n=1 Tax=Saccharopolyspora cebuensis TaxID=418759 RepID=A0ABV4CNU8_9PSEU
MTVTIPGEFALLLHKPNGGHYASSNYLGAAELGELVLRHRIEFVRRKVRVLDASPAGERWIDEALALLVRRSGPAGRPVDAARFVQSRRTRVQHASDLVRAGLMTHQREKVLGLFPVDRFHPHPAAHAQLLAELRHCADGGQLTNRLALLAALVHATRLSWSLGFTGPQRARLKQICRGEQLGTAVEHAVAAANAAMAGGAVVAATAAAG